MTESLLMFGAIAIAFLAVGALLGLYFGYEMGVKDTEGRWSEAVSLGNYQRELKRGDHA